MKLIISFVLILLSVALIPPFVIARMRVMNSDKRRIHLIQDMDLQPKLRAQQVNEHFADDRAMREPVTGTVARGELHEDEGFFRGFTSTDAGAAWMTSFPAAITVDRAFVEHGRERFNIFCRPCHGASGYGDGIVHKRADVLVSGGINGTSWVAPKSLHEEAIRAQPPGQLYNTITNGVRTMPSYASQVPVEDRWAIVAFVRALQRSQHAEDADLTDEQRDVVDAARREAGVQ